MTSDSKEGYAKCGFSARREGFDYPQKEAATSKQSTLFAMGNPQAFARLHWEYC
jgi:hypothetical protein